MGLISWLFFNRAPKSFTYIGSPAVFRGPSELVSSSSLSTVNNRGDTMRVHCVPAYISSLFIVEYPKRRELLLLDCGFPTDFERARFYVETVMKDEAGCAYTIKDNMKLAVVSHCHIDHAGASAGYHNLGVPIARTSEMETTYHGLLGKFQMFAESFLATFVATRMQRSPEDPFTYSSGFFGPSWQFMTPAIAELGDGQALPCGFDDWMAVKVPGHTAHMIALYHRSSGLFYTADTFIMLAKGFFPPTPINYGWAYEHTLQRVRDLNVQCVLMAHGGIVKTEAFGSWHDILDQVTVNFERGRNKKSAPTQRKKGSSFLSDLMGIVSLRIFNSIDAEARSFTPNDLCVGNVPASNDSRVSAITFDS